jgi:hypothetical protein
MKATVVEIWSGRSYPDKQRRVMLLIAEADTSIVLPESTLGLDLKLDDEIELFPYINRVETDLPEETPRG